MCSLTHLAIQSHAVQGLVPSRKKEMRNPRVHMRRKFEKAVKRCVAPLMVSYVAHNTWCQPHERRCPNAGPLRRIQGRDDRHPQHHRARRQALVGVAFAGHACRDHHSACMHVVVAQHKQRKEQTPLFRVGTWRAACLSGYGAGRHWTRQHVTRHMPWCRRSRLRRSWPTASTTSSHTPNAWCVVWRCVAVCGKEGRHCAV